MHILNQWADRLRVIGRYLDSLDEARNVKIETSRLVAVKWETRRGEAKQQAYAEFDIDKLREQGPLMRQPVAPPPTGEREELLRTLGQELDNAGATADEIVEIEDSFRVSGASKTGAYFRFFSRDELRKLSAERRALRGTSPTTSST